MINQFLVDGDEPLLFHTGPRRLFPIVSHALTQVRPVEELRWITFGHLEADECGAMNLFLAAAPHAQIAHGRIGCEVNIDDLADRPPRPLDSGDVIDIGAHRLRYIATPHVPHAWDAGVYYDEITGTLLCGDLFTAVGKARLWSTASWSGRSCLPRTCTRPPASPHKQEPRCVASLSWSQLPWR